MSDPEESIAILEQLSAMGVLVSVDDFGTGYSSMSYLRRLPIDKLKIDRVFINEIASRPEDASIVRAIVSLAHSLRLKVVAEGVETAGAAGLLERHWLRRISGVLISAVRCRRASSSGWFARKPSGSQPLTQDDAMRTHSKLAAYRRKIERARMERSSWLDRPRTSLRTGEKRARTGDGMALRARR